MEFTAYRNSPKLGDLTKSFPTFQLFVPDSRINSSCYWMMSFLFFVVVFVYVAFRKRRARVKTTPGKT